MSCTVALSRLDPESALLSLEQKALQTVQTKVGAHATPVVSGAPTTSERRDVMPGALSDKTIELVKATVPALEGNGLAITDRMYERLFSDPEIRDLFNQSHHGETGSQSKALAAAIIAYARNIENLGVLASRVERITQKHVGLRAGLTCNQKIGEEPIGFAPGRQDRLGRRVAE